MFNVLGCEMRYLQISSPAGAGDKEAVLRPDADGEVWIIAAASGHNDEGALQGRWIGYGNTLSLTVHPYVTVGSVNERVPIYGHNVVTPVGTPMFALPIAISRDNYYVWKTYGLGAGKYSKIDAIVYVIRGVPV